MVRAHKHTEHTKGAVSHFHVLLFFEPVTGRNERTGAPGFACVVPPCVTDRKLDHPKPVVQQRVIGAPGLNIPSPPPTPTPQLSHSGAGTDANVYIVIFGKEGDTGKVALDNPLK